MQKNGFGGALSTLRAVAEGEDFFKNEIKRLKAEKKDLEAEEEDETSDYRKKEIAEEKTKIDNRIKELEKSDDANVMKREKATHGDDGKALGILKTLGASLQSALNQGLLNNNFKNHARGNFSVCLFTDQFNHSKAQDIDWYITSWNFKPSTQFYQYKNEKTNKTTPFPLWVDFNVSLTTNMSLSNYQLNALFKKEE